MAFVDSNDKSLTAVVSGIGKSCFSISNLVSIDTSSVDDVKPSGITVLDIFDSSWLFEIFNCCFRLILLSFSPRSFIDKTGGAALTDNIISDDDPGEVSICVDKISLASFIVSSIFSWPLVVIYFFSKVSFVVAAAVEH